MAKLSSPEHLEQLAAEMILEASSLTDELTDEEARPLIAWGLAQAEATAREVKSAGRILAVLPAQDHRAVLAQQLAPVRRAIKAINALAADRSSLSPQDIVEELTHIRALSRWLPYPPPSDITDTALAELAAWQTSWDNAAFVWAILALLEAEHAIRETPEQTQDLGDNDDSRGKEDTD